MRKRKNLIQDGVKMVPDEELQSFIGFAKVVILKASKYNRKWRDQPVTSITIPIQIVRNLRICKYDKLLVAVKKATPQEIEEYTVKPRKKINYG